MSNTPAESNTVSLRDYVDHIAAQRDLGQVGHHGRHKDEWQAHDRVHQLEDRALEVLSRLVADQRLEDANNVKVALHAVQAAASIHAVAHEQQHNAHQSIHDVEKEALQKAAEQMDRRMEGISELREQMHVQYSNFVSSEVFNARIDGSATDRIDLRRILVDLSTRVTSLEVGLATKAASGDATSKYVLAVIGFVITFVVTAVVILANVLTKNV